MVSREDYLRKEYEARINRAIDFVYNNYQDDFELTALADAANFSRFHFHRLFQAYTGETPAEFVRRHRLDRRGPCRWPAATRSERPARCVVLHPTHQMRLLRRRRISFRRRRWTRIACSLHMWTMSNRHWRSCRCS